MIRQVLPGSRKILTIAAVFALATTMSACGTSAPPSEGTSSGPTPIRVGYPGPSINFQDIALSIAQNKGFFKKNNVDVSITNVNGEALVQQSLISNKLDVGIGGNPVFFQGAASDSGLKIFLETAPLQQYLLMANKDVTSFNQAANKKVGISSPGNISELLPLIDLRNHGIDINGIERIAVGGSGDRAKSLVSGTTQLSVIVLPYALTLAKGQDGITILDNLGESLKGFKFEAHVTSPSFLKAHRQALIAYSTAMLQATQYVLDHKDETVSEYMSLVKGSVQADVEESYDMLIAGGGLDPRGGLSKADYETTAKALVEFKVLKKVQPYADIYDTSIRDEALKSITAAPAN